MQNQNTQIRTLEQAISEWRAGKLCALVEYRSSKAEPIRWRDKDTHMTMNAVTLTHSVETETQTIMVSERVDDNFDWKDYKAPFTKGQKAIVFFDSVGRNKGVTTLYGKLEPVTESKPLDTKPPNK